jgi:uncharacterized protein (DUF2342 family)
MSEEIVPSRREVFERALVTANAELIVSLATGMPPSLAGVVAVVGEGIMARQRRRGHEFVGSVAQEAGADKFRSAIEEDPEREALFLSSLETAMATGLDNKRVYLARVVAHAFKSDEPIDEALLIAGALRELDGPHIRALARLKVAEDMNQDDPGHNDQILQAALRKEPSPVLATLARAGVVRQGSEQRGKGLYSIPRAETYSITGVNDFGRKILAELASS